MADKILTTGISAALDGAKSAKIDVKVDTGHLTIDGLAEGEKVLASGTLEYFEHQGQPTQSLTTSDGEATLTVRGGGKPHSWLRLPWSGCGGAYAWQIHLNPTVASDVTAYTGGGNVKLDLAHTAVTHLSANSGGGNMDVALPDAAADLNATAKTGGGNLTVRMGSGTTGSSTVDATSGAGNVVVHLPSGLAARVHATSGLGKVIVDPAYGQIDKNTYQSPDYESATDRVEITAKSGAGNVVVDTK